MLLDGVEMRKEIDINAGGGNIARGFFYSNFNHENGVYYVNPFRVNSFYFKDFIFWEASGSGSELDSHPGCYWMVLK